MPQGGETKRVVDNSAAPPGLGGNCNPIPWGFRPRLLSSAALRLKCGTSKLARPAPADLRRAGKGFKIRIGDILPRINALRVAAARCARCHRYKTGIETVSCLLLLLSLLLTLPNTTFADWPQFRGVNSSGIGSGSPPVEFGPGKNELWKTDLALGHSSPCVVGGLLRWMR